MKKVLIIIGLLFSVIIVSHPQTDFKNSKEWTVMVYLDADNNLESAGIDDINEMEAIGSDENVNIVVQMDRIDGYDSSNGDWTSTRRYYIEKDSNGYDSNIISTMEEDLGEVNMGKEETVKNFIDWSVQNYPADRYFIIFWNHGGGWR